MLNDAEHDLLAIAKFRVKFSLVPSIAVALRLVLCCEVGLCVKCQRFLSVCHISSCVFLMNLWRTVESAHVH